jgi:hypothetical protein
MVFVNGVGACQLSQPWRYFLLDLLKLFDLADSARLSMAAEI